MRSMISRSISIVNRLRASAHGTRTCRTPWVGQSTRGTRAWRLAQAGLDGLTLVTSDAAFEAYDVRLLDARA